MAWQWGSGEHIWSGGRGALGWGTLLHPRPQLQMKREWGQSQECPAHPHCLCPSPP